MATKKKKAPEKRKVQNIKSLSQRTMILVGVVILILAIFIMNRTQLFLEGKHFDEYSQDTSITGRNVAAQTNPAQTKKVEYCDRTNLKYEKGSLSCLSSYYIRYETTIPADAQRLDFIVRNVISTNHRDLKVQGGDSLDPNKLYSGTYDFNGAWCGYEVIQSKKELGLLNGLAYPFKKNTTGTLIKIYCIAPAKASHYKYVEY